MHEALLDGLRQRDRRALARLLTLAARGDHVADIIAGLPAPAKPSRVVAVTGSPGVGKSTLIGRLIEHLRGQNLTVAVLACDPQSPLSGGALLGDRFRMASAVDEGVFIRSLAAPGDRGAIAERLDVLIRILEAFGFDVVIVETVGAGQGDTAVRALVDVVLLLLQPESGDDLQWEKAGLLEVADVIAVHKADLPGAEQTAAQVRSMLSIGRSSEIPVLQVSSKAQNGLVTLWEAIAATPLRRTSRPNEDLLPRLQHELTRRFEVVQTSPSAAWRQVLADWQRGEPSAVGQALSLLSQITQPS